MTEREMFRMFGIGAMAGSALFMIWFVGELARGVFYFG